MRDVWFRSEDWARTTTRVRCRVANSAERACSINVGYRAHSQSTNRLPWTRNTVSERREFLPFATWEVGVVACGHDEEHLVLITKLIQGHRKVAE